MKIFNRVKKGHRLIGIIKRKYDYKFVWYKGYWFLIVNIKGTTLEFTFSDIPKAIIFLSSKVLPEKQFKRLIKTIK